MDSSILARVCLHYVKETAINFEKIALLVFTLSKSILIYYSARSQLSAWVTPTVDFRVWDRSGFYNRGYFGSLSVVVWVTAKFWGKEDKEKFNFKDFTVKKKKKCSVPNQSGRSKQFVYALGSEEVSILRLHPTATY